MADVNKCCDLFVSSRLCVTQWWSGKETLEERRAGYAMVECMSHLTNVSVV